MTITTPIQGVICRFLVTLHIAYLCQKFDDSSFSYSWGMFRALKIKVDHVTWPRPFQVQFVVRRLGLATINRCTKFQMYTITCNEDMKGNAKICKNSRFEPPFGGLKGNTQGSSMARWKAHCRLPINDNWTFSLALTAEAQLSEIFRNRRFLNGWVTLSANFRWMGTSPQSIYGPLDIGMM